MFKFKITHILAEYFFADTLYISQFYWPDGFDVGIVFSETRSSLITQRFRNWFRIRWYFTNSFQVRVLFPYMSILGLGKVSFPKATNESPIMKTLGLELLRSSFIKNYLANWLITGLEMSFRPVLPALSAAPPFGCLTVRLQSCHQLLLCRNLVF